MVRCVLTLAFCTLYATNAWQFPINRFVFPFIASERKDVESAAKEMQQSKPILKAILASAILSFTMDPTLAKAADPALKSTLSQYKQTVEVVSDTSASQFTKATSNSESVPAKVATPAPKPVVKPSASVVTTKKQQSKAVSQTEEVKVKAPRLVEEIALDGALRNRDTGKARVLELTKDIKKAKQDIATSEGEVKKLAVSLERTESRLRKKGIDNDIKRVINEEKSDLDKRIAEKKMLLRTLEKSIDRKEVEIRSLVNRLQSDEAIIKQRTAELKKKRDFMIAQEESKRVDAIKKEIGKFIKDKEKTDSALKSAIERGNKFKEELRREEATLKADIVAEEQISKIIEGLKKSLEKQQSDLLTAKNKEADLQSKIIFTKNSISAAEKEAKEKEALLKSLKSSIEKEESLIKKR